MPEAGVMRMAEELIPRLRVADWLDRAEAAQRQLEHLDLRDLRSVVASADDPLVARDESTRTLAVELKAALVTKQEEELALWLADVEAALDVGRVVRALRLSSVPPKAGVPFPGALAARLAEATTAALQPVDGPDRWSAVLEAAAFSPVRSLVAPTAPAEQRNDELLATVRRLAPLLPQIAALYGVEVPAGAAVPKPLRPTARRREPTRRPAGDGKSRRDQATSGEGRRTRPAATEPRADRGADRSAAEREPASAAGARGQPSRDPAPSRAGRTSSRRPSAEPRRCRSRVEPEPTEAAPTRRRAEPRPTPSPRPSRARPRPATRTPAPRHPPRRTPPSADHLPVVRPSPARLPTIGVDVRRRPLRTDRPGGGHHAQPARGAQRRQWGVGNRPRVGDRPARRGRRALGRHPPRQHRGPGTPGVLRRCRPEGDQRRQRRRAAHGAGRVRRLRLPRAAQAGDRGRRRTGHRRRLRDRPRRRSRGRHDPVGVRAGRGQAQPRGRRGRTLPAATGSGPGHGDGGDPHRRADPRRSRVRARHGLSAGGAGRGSTPRRSGSPSRSPDPRPSPCGRAGRLSGPPPPRTTRRSSG